MDLISGFVRLFKTDKSIKNMRHCTCGNILYSPEAICERCDTPVNPQQRKNMNEIIPWKNRVNRAINALCRAEYIKTNQLPNGRMRIKHTPYSVPQEAIDLIECLNTNNEPLAKSMLMHDYALRNV
jgi:hypothetical protein